jgi:hypothetical protein
VDRGGKDTREQNPALKDAAKGLKWSAIKEAYTVAGLTPPEYAKDAFKEEFDTEQVAALEATLRNRRLLDLLPTDVPYPASELAPALKGDVDADADDLPWADTASGSTSGDPVDRATVDPGVDPGEPMDTAESVQADAELTPLPLGSAPIDAALGEDELAHAKLLAESFGGVVENGPAK